LTAAPLTLFTLVAVISASKATVDEVRAVQFSWIGDNGPAKRAPVPATSAMPVAVWTNPPGRGLTSFPLEECVTIEHPQSADFEALPAATVVVTLYMPELAGVTEVTTVDEPRAIGPRWAV
jgi:hypothetical protein